MYPFEKFKTNIAIFLCRTKVIEICERIRDLIYGNNYVRIINYHGVPKEFEQNFEEQVCYFISKYKTMDLEDLDNYFKGKIHTDKPMLLITFDDGYKDNYDYAVRCLDKYGVKAFFFVVADKIGDEDRMNTDMLRSMIRRGHEIGSHTSSHYRFNEKSDDYDKNYHEIIDSKFMIEERIEKTIRTFCWCGGEYKTYSSSAEKLIEENYDYSFLTNAGVISRKTSPFNLNRINIESRWKIELVRFQLSGILDLLYLPKRLLVKRRLRYGKHR